MAWIAGGSGSNLEQGLPRSWGSGDDGRLLVIVVGSREALAETGAERAVVDGAANLEQPVGASAGPAHLRWSPSVGQFDGLDRLGSGFRQAANLSIRFAPYASSGVCPAKELCGRRVL